MNIISMEHKNQIRNNFKQWLEEYCNSNNIPMPQAYVLFSKRAPKKDFTQSHIAALLNISTSMVQHLLSGRRNASYLIAKQFAQLTSTDIELWALGCSDSAEARREAIKAWAERGAQ